jgi:hypothetical protein
MLLALRSPPFLPRPLTAFLFENHYLWWLAVLALGIVLILLARSRSNRQLLRSGQFTLALGILWILAAFLITTPAERLYNAHLALADATAKADVDRILSYFAPNFVAHAGPVQILDSTSSPQAKNDIAAAIKLYGIKETYIRSYNFTLTSPTSATTNVTALTLAEQTLLTTWQVTWDDLPDQDWRIAQADLTKIGDQTIEPGMFNAPTPHLP